jgi:hypothetical protein
MTTLDKFLDDYKNYIIRNSVDHVKGAKTAEEYSKYLFSACLDVGLGAGIISDIATSSSPLYQTRQCNIIINELDLVISGKKSGCKSKKTFQNYKSAVNKLLDFVNRRVSFAKSISSSTRTSSAPKVREGEKAKKIPLIRGGADENGYYVRYEEGIAPCDRVKGLVYLIECEYQRVVDFAKKYFSCCENAIRPIKVILSEDTPTRIYEESAEFILKRIQDVLIGEVPADIQDEIQSIINKRVYSLRVSGRFVYNQEPTIIIYYRNISGINWEMYSRQIANVLMHEYVHYLEYAHCVRHGAEPLTNSYVSESIADFTAFLYLLEQASSEDLMIANQRFFTWRRHFGEGCAWPYAYALLFCVVGGEELYHTERICDYDNFGCIDKLKEVFEETINVESAYDKLLKI